MPRGAHSTTCIAQGTDGDVAWTCSRPAAGGGLCEGHRKARQRGRPMKPLREHFRGPPALVTVRITQEELAQLGADPAARAAAILRAVLAERRHRGATRPAQLRLGFLPGRRRGG
ncbi:MAG TPA: hypothetical protein VFP65_18010 [Anaeromyxobacteraceae bacterium]|nr:hypothetical protein [Anaeromyxobacteraceae bacterium]